MKVVLGILGLIVFSVLVVMSHEHDLYRQCVKEGHDNSVGWFIDINCSPRTNHDI